MNVRFRQELEPEPGREDDLRVYLVALSRRLKRTCRRVLLRFGFWFYALRIIILILISFLSFKVCLDLDQNILSVCLDSRCGDGGSVCWSVSHHAPRPLLRGPAAGSGVLRWIFKVDLWLQEVFPGSFGEFAEFKQNNQNIVAPHQNPIDESAVCVSCLL